MNIEERLQGFQTRQHRLGKILESVVQQFSNLQEAVRCNSDGVRTNSENMKDMSQAVRSALEIVNTQQSNVQELVEQLRSQQDVMQVLLAELQNMQTRMKGIETENARILSTILDKGENGRTESSN